MPELRLQRTREAYQDQLSPSLRDFMRDLMARQQALTPEQIDVMRANLWSWYVTGDSEAVK